MPFAKKFIHTFALPRPGESLGDYEVISVEIGHEGIGSGVYRYPIRIAVAGKGGQQGVLSTFRRLVPSRKTTFSGYGNPYQLWFGKLSVATVSAGVYEVTGEGWGARFDLESELSKFISYLCNKGLLPSNNISEETYTEYLEHLQVQARRKQKLG